MSDGYSVQNQMKSVPTSDEFNRLSIPNDGCLYGFLLYTDENKEIVEYVRRDYNLLDKMSGPNCKVYVIERPVSLTAEEMYRDWTYSISYIMSIFQNERQSKPYDTSQAYDIARYLGVFTRQLPCIVFFNWLDDPIKIVIPIPQNIQLHSFFQTLFGLIEEELFTVINLDKDQKPQGILIKDRLEEIKTKLASLGEKLKKM
jgi:hypothetical protein